MSPPIAYLRGEFLPEAEARLHVFDLGIVGGVAVSEMLRTFRHRPYRAEDHLERLRQSLELTGLTPRESLEDLQAALEQVVARNAAGIPQDRDLGVIVFVTAGLNPTYVGKSRAIDGGCSVGIHTFPLHGELWAEKYSQGVRLVTPEIPAIPREVLDPRIKSRSRLHWHQAERAARRREPGSTAVLCNARGELTETAASNLCLVVSGELISPPPGDALEGVSLKVLLELADSVGLACHRRRVTVADCLGASEILLTSTPPCLLPATALNGQPIGAGRPGEVYHRLLDAWSAVVGVDIAAQMELCK